MNSFIEIILYVLLGILIIILIDFILIFLRIGFDGVRFIKNIRKKNLEGIYAKNQKNILIVGDSTAEAPGVKLSETIGNYLANKYNSNLIDLAINGAKTKDVLKQIDKVKDKKFKAIFIFCGNNDLWTFSNLRKTTNYLNLIIKRAKTMSNRIIVFRGGNFGNLPFFPYFLRPILTLRARKMKDSFKKVCDSKKVSYVEKWMERKEDIFLKNPKRYYSPDLLHLNSNGYKVWIKEIMNEIKKWKLK